MSVIDISGLPGDSIHTSRVAGVIAAATLAAFVVSTCVNLMPARSVTLCSSR